MYFFPTIAKFKREMDGMVSVSMLIWSQFRCRYLKVFTAFLLWSHNRIICYWNSRGKCPLSALFTHQSFVLQMMRKNKSKHGHYPYATYKGSHELCRLKPTEFSLSWKFPAATWGSGHCVWEQIHFKMQQYWVNTSKHKWFSCSFPVFNLITRSLRCSLFLCFVHD